VIVARTERETSDSAAISGMALHKAYRWVCDHVMYYYYFYIIIIIAFEYNYELQKLNTFQQH